MKKTPYNFNETVLHMLCEALRKQYLGVKMEIQDIYILHSPDHSPKLVIKARMPDGSEVRTDLLFFEDEL